MRPTDEARAKSAVRLGEMFMGTMANERQGCARRAPCRSTLNPLVSYILLLSSPGKLSCFVAFLFQPGARLTFPVTAGDELLVLVLLLLVVVHGLDALKRFVG